MSIRDTGGYFVRPTQRRLSDLPSATLAKRLFPHHNHRESPGLGVSEGLPCGSFRCRMPRGRWGGWSCGGGKVGREPPRRGRAVGGPLPSRPGGRLPKARGWPWEVDGLMGAQGKSLSPPAPKNAPAGQGRHRTKTGLKRGKQDLRVFHVASMGSRVAAMAMSWNRSLTWPAASDGSFLRT
jgi:hypothetical protein